MTTFLLPKQDRSDALARIVRAIHDLPEKEHMVQIKPLTKGEKRSIEQNRLQRLWMKEAAEQLGEYTAEEYRAYCKLHIGVPILREDDEEFCAAYDRVIKPHSYEDKLAMMAVPLDFPVTRLMTKKQKTKYLDKVWEHFTSLDVQLTDPEGKWS